MAAHGGNVATRRPVCHGRSPSRRRSAGAMTSGPLPLDRPRPGPHG
jgi:hypothetical protein